MRPWSGAIAAVVILGLTIWLGVWGWTTWRASFTDQAKDRLASLAVSMHAHRPTLTIETTRPQRVEQELGGYLPEPVVIPALAEGFELIGAAPVNLGGYPVVLSRWRYRGREYSLYQFCAAQFDLPSDLPRQQLIKALDPAQSRHEVRIWTENHCAYALVTELNVHRGPSAGRSVTI